MIRLLNWMGRGVEAIDWWKRAIALCVMWGFVYAMVLWQFLVWGTDLVTWAGDLKPPIPHPPILPWEQLFAAAGALGVVGTIQFLRDKKKGE